MTASNFKIEDVTNFEDEYSVPLDLTDIINICREYNKLGWQIQNQVESIVDVGVEQSIESGVVKKSALPHIKHFLKKVTDNVYFGDSVTQANDAIVLIDFYLDKCIDPFIN